MIRRACVFALVAVASANTALAQQKAPIGIFAADVRVASSGLPADQGWTPAVPAATVLPSRGLGFDIGAHVYVLRFRAIALGVGGSLLRARASSSPPEIEDTTPSTPAPPSLVPNVTTRVTSLAPQLSLNFGHSLGWSYLSAGLGRARVESEAALPSSGTTFTPRNSDWVKTLNFGGGARWFLNDHLGVGFDVRWHKLGLLAATNTRPSGPRVSMLVAGAGLVVK